MNNALDAVRGTACFDLTYEGLKSVSKCEFLIPYLSFDLTYEGLKYSLNFVYVNVVTCFDLTYEGLKY